MRVAWLDGSDVSRFSLQLLKQLGGDPDPQFECHAFLAGTGTASSPPVPFARLAPNAMFSEVLATYDTVIFNMGCGEGAATVLQTLRRVPGVLILHERSYQSLFVRRCFDQLQSPSAFARLMHGYYGARGIDDLLHSGASDQACPLIEPIAALASALVVHSDEMQNYAKSFFRGPILRLDAPIGSDDAHEGNSRRYLDLLKAFVRDNRELLRRRARLVAPARDALPQPSPQPSDEQWWQSLLRARSAHNDLERDPDTRSPEPFIKWSDHDLARLISFFFLDAREPMALAQSILPFLSDRWQMYEVVSKLRWLQELGQVESTHLGDVTLPPAPIGDTQFWGLACQLKPPVFARLLYLAILQRPPKDYESNGWAQLVESGRPPADVLKRFLATTESRELRADRLLDELVAWAEEQAQVQSLTSGDDAAEWPQDLRIHFGDASGQTLPKVLGDWYPPEPVGRWTNGRSGGLSFRVPADLVSSLALSLRVRVAGTGRTGPRNLVAYCNGYRAASLQLADDGPREWIIPLNCAASHHVTVALIADRSFSPASADGSSDVRDLGIMLIEAVLIGDDAAHPAAAT